MSDNLFQKYWLVAVVFLCLVLIFAGCAPETLEPLPVGPTNGWSLFHPLPGGYDLYDIWGDSPSNIWAVGVGGTIVHWDGQSLQRVDCPLEGRLESIDGFARDNLYVSGRDVILHYDGSTWDRFVNIPGEKIEGLLCTEANQLYVVGTMGLKLYDNSGWQPVVGPSSSASVIWLGRDKKVRIGDSNLIWRVDNKIASIEQDFGDWRVILGDGNYAVTQKNGENRHLLALSNQYSWTLIDDSLTRAYALLDVGPPIYSDNSGLVVDGQQIWTNSGGHWIYNLAACGDGGLLACGYGSTLVYGGGESSSFRYNELSSAHAYHHFKCMDGSGCDNIWAGEWGGRVMHYDGQTWQREYSRLSTGWPVSRIQVTNDGWVVAGADGEISTRDPSTESWSYITSGLDRVHRFFVFEPDSILAATADEFVLWNGESWQGVGPAEYTVNNMDATASGKLYILMAGDDNPLRTWNGSAVTTVIDTPQFISAILHCSRMDETVWIVGKIGVHDNFTPIFRYRNGVFQEITNEIELPSVVNQLSELSTDDLFILAEDRLLRFKDGMISQEVGLPSRESYELIWSHPDCGVFVGGHSTFFKRF